MDVQFVKKTIEQNREKWHQWSDAVWAHPETGLMERDSQKILCDALEKEGFSVEKGVADMPTSFVATWGSGKPVLGFTAEYDALPGLSQEAGRPEKCALQEGGAGHGCGHNLLGVGAIAAACIVKAFLEKEKKSGTIKIFGTPSEERDAGKSFMARDGVFDGLDAGFTWHPFSMNTVWDTGSLANTIVTFRFKGVSAHAAAAPELGRSALDACELMNVGVNYLREHVPSSVRIHYAYLDVGGSAPNVVQPTAAVYYFIRAPKMALSTSVYHRVQDCARGAALMTGTEVSEEFDVALSDYVPNPTLSAVMQQAMKDIGPQELDASDRETAQSFIKTLDAEYLQAQKDFVARFLGREKAEQIAKDGLMTDVIDLGENSPMATGSTDVGDFSNCVPTAQCLIATAAFATPLHSWQMVSQGKTGYAKKGMERAAGTIALTAIRALNDPEILDKAHREFVEETGGRYHSPMPAQIKPRDPAKKA